MPDYECHVTVVNDPNFVEKFKALARYHAFSTSVIDGDPILGDGDKFYFTMHDKQYNVIYNQMFYLVRELRKMGATVLREKIEEIIHDVRHEV